MHYRTIFISDVHLGTRDCKADLLNNFLKHNSADQLYLVGDIIDAWKIQQNRWRWRQSHTNVVRPGITGVMDFDLARAVRQCLALDREQIRQDSRRWTWQACWQIFKENLVPAQAGQDH